MMVVPRLIWRIELANRCKVTNCAMATSVSNTNICKKLVWLPHSKVVPTFLFFLFHYFLSINTSKIIFSHSKIFLCSANIFKLMSFSSSEKQYLWWHFYIFVYHSSEKRLSEGSEYQCRTPLTLPLNPTPLILQPFSREWCSTVSERTEYSC